MATRRAMYFVKNYHPAHAGVLFALQVGGYEPTLVVARAGRPEHKSGDGLYATNSLHLPASGISRLLLRPGAKSTYGRELPQIGTLIRMLVLHRPELTLVYERSVRSTVTAWFAFLVGSEVVQVLDTPSRRLKSRSHRQLARLPLLWLQHLLSPKLRMHSGGLGEEVGKSISLGPFLGKSTLSPYPIAAGRGSDRTRLCESPIRIVVMAGSNPNRTQFEMVLRALAPLINCDLIKVEFLLWPGHVETQSAEVRSAEQDLGLRESKIQPGVSTGGLREFLGAFDVMIYASHRGSYGHAVSVALAAGVPVVCSEKMGASVLIRNGVNGFTHRPKDMLQLRAIVQNLSENSDTIALLSQQALNLADEEFSPRAWLANLESLRSKSA